MYTRKCPECGMLLLYKTPKSYKKAVLKNTSCVSCVRCGTNHYMYGKHHSIQTRNRMKVSHIGKVFSEQHRMNLSHSLLGVHSGRTLTDEHKQKIGTSLSGHVISDATKLKIGNSNRGKQFVGRKMPPMTDEHKNNIRLAKLGTKMSVTTREKQSLNNARYWRGKHLSIETKEKMRNAHLGMIPSDECRRKRRVSMIKRIKDLWGNVYPNFNPIACQRIDEYGKQHDYDFQHALNGGEFHIKELGYFVDGYDKEKNVVVEYYEPWHKTRFEKDAQRKQEIMNHLGCKFIELHGE